MNFGLAGGEKQDLLIPYLLAVIPKEPAGPGSSLCGLADNPWTLLCPWECSGPTVCLGGKPERTDKTMGQMLCWHGRAVGTGRDEPGTGCARARALPAGETSAGASGKAKGLSFKGL